MIRLLLFLLVAAPCAAAPATSSYPTPPPGDHLVILKAPYFPVRGDGKADDTAAIREAIGAAQRRGNVLLVPPGDYRVTDTIVVPKRMRLLGYGKRRPRFVVTENTPGWSGPGKKHLIYFGAQRGLQGNDTFFSGLDNIDLEIRPGNPAGVAVHYSVAQGTVFRNSDIRLSEGNTGFDSLGSEISNCRVFGGERALTGSSIAWQVLVMDCVFDGQRQTAADVSNTGLTAIRCHFRNTPRGVTVKAGKSDRLFIKDGLFENIGTAAVTISPESMLTMESSVFSEVAALVDVRGKKPVAATAGSFAVESLTHGLHVGTSLSGELTKVKETRSSPLKPLAAKPKPPAGFTDIPALPDPAEWTNVRAHGVRGDGKTDDTTALQAAIERHATLYLPPGRYLISDTLRLNPATRLIGLHPSGTMIRLKERSPGFGDPARPKALLETARDGRPLVAGIGFDPGIHPGAVSVIWRAPGGFLGDFWIEWKDQGKHGESQHCGLWIDGGAGIFKNLTISHRRPPTGLRITDSPGPGRIYMASVEHKPGTEIHFKNARDWDCIALQTEHSPEPEGMPESLPILLEDCRRVRLLNPYVYRTSANQRPSATGIRIDGGGDLTVRGLYNFSLSPFPARNSVELPRQGLAVSERQITELRVP